MMATEKMTTDEAAGRALIAKVREEIKSLLKAEGFAMTETECHSPYVNVRTGFDWNFSHQDFNTIKLTVRPRHGLGYRETAYRIKVKGATPQNVTAQIRKAVAKALEIKGAGEKDAEHRRDGALRKQARAAEVREAIAAALPGFENTGDGSLYLAPGVKVDVSPVPNAPGEEVRVTLRLPHSFTLEQAREVIDLVNRMGA